jgi:hypothetical protein
VIFCDTVIGNGDIIALNDEWNGSSVALGTHTDAIDDGIMIIAMIAMPIMRHFVWLHDSILLVAMTG